ncbi:hypothetical protein DWY77_07740 [Megamonas rupellensis]|jgi:hypothetical protein|uniref:Uncharacterized protein n=1 Tax=Megamonas rupellensis TaxID=491921 RepID=A0A412CDI9_9FIRM|nr:hypothetical protein [Megamonas rupellensis]RGQ81787.1 hypothetical protein DWY77_07740 [Megamonas rupellensis]
MNNTQKTNQISIDNLLKNIIDKISVLEESSKLIIEQLILLNDNYNNLKNQIIKKDKDIENIDELLRLLLSNQLITNFENQINMSKASLKSNYINEDSNGIKKNTAFNILGYLDNNFNYPEIYRINNKL